MPLHLPTLLTRTGSAIVFGAVMLGGLLWNNGAFLVLVLLIHGLCLRDYFRLAAQVDGAGPSPAAHTATQIAGALWLAGLGSLFLSLVPGIVPSFLRQETPLVAFLVVLIFPAALLLASGLTRRMDVRHAFRAFGGVAYITLALACLILLRGRQQHLPLALILMIWANDTLAYLVGSLIGKTPFSPISPKKTWEGTAGGALLTLIGAAIAGYLIPGASLKIYLGLAVCATVFGTLGDLLESKLKRLAGVKDSGNLMPGHGGALDRFDSLLIAAPFAYAWIEIARVL